MSEIDEPRESDSPADPPMVVKLKRMIQALPKTGAEMYSDELNSVLTTLQATPTERHLLMARRVTDSLADFLMAVRREETMDAWKKELVNIWFSDNQV